MFGFGKRVNKVKQEVKKMENRDLLEAVVGGCLLVAAADGDIEDSEVKKIDLDSLPRTEFNWRPKHPKPPSRIEPSAKSKQFTARRRMVELQRDLNRIEREFAL